MKVNLSIGSRILKNRTLASLSRLFLFAERLKVLQSLLEVRRNEDF